MESPTGTGDGTSGGINNTLKQNHSSGSTITNNERNNNSGNGPMYQTDSDSQSNLSSGSRTSLVQRKKSRFEVRDVSSKKSPNASGGRGSLTTRATSGESGGSGSLSERAAATAYEMGGISRKMKDRK